MNISPLYSAKIAFTLFVIPFIASASYQVSGGSGAGGGDFVGRGICGGGYQIVGSNSNANPDCVVAQENAPSGSSGGSGGDSGGGSTGGGSTGGGWGGPPGGSTTTHSGNSDPGSNDAGTADGGVVANAEPSAPTDSGTHQPGTVSDTADSVRDSYAATIPSVPLVPSANPFARVNFGVAASLLSPPSAAPRGGVLGERFIGSVNHFSLVDQPQEFDTAALIGFVLDNQEQLARTNYRWNVFSIVVSNITLLTFLYSGTYLRGKFKAHHASKRTTRSRSKTPSATKRRSKKK